MSPLCFVLMPFGSKHDPAGGPDIDFDRVPYGPPLGTLLVSPAGGSRPT